MSEEHVKETYRELADERTPAHLDRAVLAEAASAARPRYSRLRTWTRPMAWAATVMLSAAIVLEVLNSPDAQMPESVELPAPAAPQADAPAGESLDAALEEPALLRDEYRAPAASATPLEADLEELKSAPLRSSAKQEVQETAEGARRQDALTGAEAGQAVEQRRARVTSDAFDVSDSDIVREAEEMSALREGAAVYETSNFAPAALASSAAAPLCEAPATDAARTWFDCVLQLEELGFTERAQRERELLAAAFPDFNMEATSVSNE